MKKSIILSAIAALGFGNSAVATAPTVDLFPATLGKKKQTTRKRRMRSLPEYYVSEMPVKRAHKDRHKKGRP